MNCRICSGSVHRLETLLNADAWGLVLFLGRAAFFLDVIAPSQQGCRVLYISKHERLGKSESKK
jgi:hypothetical protein